MISLGLVFTLVLHTELFTTLSTWNQKIPNINYIKSKVCWTGCTPRRNAALLTCSNA